MAFVVAALVLVGALSVVNLLFSFGVIRRLREHTALLDRRVDGMSPFEATRPVGETVDDFAASTVDGEPISRDLLTGTTLVGFFSPSCAPCRERLPTFVEQARDHEPVLAVVVAPEGDEGAPAVVDELRPVARVVREAPDGPLATAFGVHGFPAFALIGSDGEVIASGIELTALRVPAAA
jgi:thiol-disulfide isomerase/thioredoxin